MPRGKNKSGTDGRLLFKDLAIGEVFEFQRHWPGMAVGPWRKVSARKYERTWDSMVCNIGSVNSEVVR